MNNTTKNIILIAAQIALIFTLISQSVYSQATATGHISAEVVDAITANQSSPMNFGSFSANDEGGSITIPTNGEAIVTSAIVPKENNLNPASFSISGAKDGTFSVMLPTGPATLTSLMGDTMMVSNWTASSDQGTDSCLLAGGAQKINVGATLNVGSIASNQKGTFTGSYQVTFAYN